VGGNFNNQVAEILSRSRKVRSQIPNKTNFVTARDDGQKANSLSSCTHFGIPRTLIPQKLVWHATGGIDLFDGGLDIIVIFADSFRSQLLQGQEITYGIMRRW